MRIFIELAYDGTNYHGWQRQPEDITVQQVLEAALERLCGNKCPVLGCGRTDSGVHASYFVAHADLPESSSARFDTLEQLAFKLNGILDGDIAIFTITEVGEKAHARFDARERSYTYWIHTDKDPFLAGRSARVFGYLDVGEMQKAADKLIFQGDFAAFCKTGSDVKTTICDVRRVDVTRVQHSWREGSSGIRIDIEADRFLRNMVRAVVGTLILVGKGKMTQEEFQAVIESCDRSNAGKSAPACGLYLARVDYPEDVFMPSSK
jgi:tRNA pseudouridine38-40 synthase